MAIFKVEGGRRLRGEITPQGAKNEALQILCATLLTQEKVIVHNVPQILDVIQLIELLQAMGVEVERLSEESYSFRAADIDPDYLRSDDYCRRASRLRGSVMLLGPMLARGVGYMPKPGGNSRSAAAGSTPFIGTRSWAPRSVVRHLAACSGSRCKELKGMLHCYSSEASVTSATNIIIAAVMAKGFHDHLRRRIRTLHPATQRTSAQPRPGAHLRHRLELALTIEEGVRAATAPNFAAAARHDRGQRLHQSALTMAVPGLTIRSISFGTWASSPVRPSGHPRTARRRHLPYPTQNLPHQELHGRLDRDHNKRTPGRGSRRPCCQYSSSVATQTKGSVQFAEDVRKPPGTVDI